MWQDRVSKPGPLALEADALPTVLHSPNASIRVHAKSSPISEATTIKRGYQGEFEDNFSFFSMKTYIVTPH